MYEYERKKIRAKILSWEDSEVPFRFSMIAGLKLELAKLCLLEQDLPCTEANLIGVMGQEYKACLDALKPPPVKPTAGNESIEKRKDAFLRFRKKRSTDKRRRYRR